MSDAGELLVERFRCQTSVTVTLGTEQLAGKPGTSIRKIQRLARSLLFPPPGGVRNNTSFGADGAMMVQFLELELSRI